MKYIAVTPAHNEERFLPFLIESMRRQSCKPQRWIIVNDGSTDATGALIDDAALQCSWIEARHLSRNRPRQPGERGGAPAVKASLPAKPSDKYDFVLLLDADISFGPGFVASLMHEFRKHSRLGIASATLLERRGPSLQPQYCSSFHTRGATKMYSSQCFEAIGGLDTGPAWDCVDEARAMMLGFETKSFKHISAIHHRPVGGADGSWRVIVAGGRAAYHTGSSPLFVLARAAARFLSRPAGLGSALLLSGYVWSAIRGEPRSTGPELTKYVRWQQIRRLLLQESQWK